MSLRSLPAWSVLGLMACSGGATADKAAEGDGKREGWNTRDTLVIGYQSDIGNLISIVNETAADSYIVQSVTYPTMDGNFDCSLKKLPGIATSWDWNDDGTVLSMELRDDITWADGTPVTPQDIEFTYDLVADPKVASARISFIEHLKEGHRPKIIDNTHIEWHFTQAYDRDTQISHVTLPVIPKHVFADADRASLRGHDKANAPLASGPWALSKWEPNERIVLEPNYNFTGPEHHRPQLNRVIFRIIPEYSTRLIELESGKIDMMEAVLVADADKLRDEHPEINLVRRGWRSNDYIAWNLNNELFKDKKVRQAIAKAADIQAMIDKVLTSKTGESFARPSVSTITPALCGVHNDEIQVMSHDMAEAKKMLASAGWRDSDGDGVLDKGGEKFEFTLSTNTGNKRRADIAVLFQGQMKALGIVVNIEKTESNSFFENLRKRDYDAALAGWSAGLFIDPTDLWHCDTDDKRYEFNFTSYCNPEVDALIAKGLATPNPKDAAPIWKELQAKVYDDQPYLFLWWMDEIVAINDRFENTTIDILSPLNRLHEWEVPEDKVKYTR